MGWKDADWAYGLEFKNPVKSVLIAIAHRTDDKSHQTFVGQETIATMTGLNRSTVNRSVGVLRDARVILTQPRHMSLGYRTSDTITINRAYVDQANGATANVADNNVGDSTSPSAPQHTPKSPSATAKEITQKVTQEITQIDTPLRDPGVYFMNFWTVWPRKVGKPKARDAWFRSLKKHGADPLMVIEAARAYADNPNRPPQQFIPHPTTWLNRAGWEDELDGPRHIDNKPTPTDKARAVLSLVPQQQTKEISA